MIDFCNNVIYSGSHKSFSGRKDSAVEKASGFHPGLHDYRHMVNFNHRGERGRALTTAVILCVYKRWEHCLCPRKGTGCQGHMVYIRKSNFSALNWIVYLMEHRYASLFLSEASNIVSFSSGPCSMAFLTSKYQQSHLISSLFPSVSKVSTFWIRTKIRKDHGR